MRAPGSATTTFIEALRASGLRVTQAGDVRYLAQCPSHDDRNESLSIMQGRGGVLAYCHAGCEFRDVVSAVGLTMADTFDDPNGIDYVYRNPDGSHARTVHRSPDKKFFQRIATPGYIPLYTPGEMDLKACVAAGNQIWITEGEKDADTLWLHGCAAVSAPQGAANWDKADYSGVAGAVQVFVVADKDTAGFERARGLAHHLIDRYKVPVMIVSAAEGKDATDHLVAGHSPAEFVPEDLDPPDEAFESAVAEYIRSEKIRLEARRRLADERFGADISLLKPITLQEVLAVDTSYDWLVPDLLEKGERMIVTGGEGSGKSWFLRQIAISCAAGVDPFERYSVQNYPPMRVLTVDAENTIKQWARGTRYMASLAREKSGIDPSRNLIVQAGRRLNFMERKYIDVVHAWCDDVKPDLLYIGPLYKLVPRGLNEEEEASTLLAALDEFKERGITLLMEAHAGHAKGVGNERDMRPRGSSALLGWPEFGFGIRPADEDLDPNLNRFVRWRGDRDHRDWPEHIRRGNSGEMPWQFA